MLIIHLDLGILKVWCAENSHLVSEEAYLAPSTFLIFGKSRS